MQNWRRGQSWAVQGSSLLLKQAHLTSRQACNCPPPARSCKIVEGGVPCTRLCRRSSSRCSSSPSSTPSGGEFRKRRAPVWDCATCS